MEQFHNYHPVSFEFLGSKPMLYSPEDQEPAPPAFSTVKPLPLLNVNEQAVFDTAIDDWKIVPDYRGITYYKKTDGAEVTYKLGEQPDATVQTTIPAAVLFKRAQEVKRNEIREAFNTDSFKPVTVGTLTFNGGFDSAQKLDGALRLSERAGLTSVNFTDIKNDTYTFALPDALNIVLAVGSDYQTKFMNKQQKMVAIDNATDQAALDLIVY